MLGGTYRASFRPLNDAIMSGRIRGVAAIVGCNNPRSQQDYLHTYVTKELLKQDVLIVETGCGAIASAKLGLLLGEAGLDQVGPGLREVCETVGIPPVLHMGSCVDNSRILTVLTQMVEEGGLGDDIDQVPAVGLAPEWMSEKALSIGTYCVASGAYVIFGGSSPVSGMPDRVADSDIVLKYISEGWENLYGGKLEFIDDLDEMIRQLWNISIRNAPPWVCRSTTRSASAAAAMPACWSSKSCRWKNAAQHSTAWQPTDSRTGGTMSRYIATRAIRGANALVTEAELMLNKALLEKGPDTPVAFPNTAYYLPLIHGMTGIAVENLGQLQPVIEHARELLHPLPSERHWTPYLGETLDSGMATLLAAETIEAVRFIYDLQPEPMPGFQPGWRHGLHQPG